MPLSDKTFQVLDALDRHDIANQRQLAEHAGISLGQVNYIVKSLMQKGMVKIGNFRKSPHKIGYMYLLTPKGLRTKSQLAVKFVMRKLAEYEDLRERLGERLSFIEEKGHQRVAFVGPETVKAFVETILKESGLNLSLVEYYRHWGELKKIDPDLFDIALLFDGGLQGLPRVAEATGISREKLLPLW